MWKKWKKTNLNTIEWIKKDKKVHEETIISIQFETHCSSKSVQIQLHEQQLKGKYIQKAYNSLVIIETTDGTSETVYITWVGKQNIPRRIGKFIYTTKYWLERVDDHLTERNSDNDVTHQ